MHWLHQFNVQINRSNKIIAGSNNDKQTTFSTGSVISPLWDSHICISAMLFNICQQNISVFLSTKISIIFFLYWGDWNTIYITLMPTEAAHAFNTSWSTETIATKDEFKLSPKTNNKEKVSSRMRQRGGGNAGAGGGVGDWVGCGGGGGNSISLSYHI